MVVAVKLFVFRTRFLEKVPAFRGVSTCSLLCWSSGPAASTLELSDTALIGSKMFFSRRFDNADFPLSLEDGAVLEVLSNDELFFVLAWRLCSASSERVSWFLRGERVLRSGENVRGLLPS